jgi:hypothetical protein
MKDKLIIRVIVIEGSNQHEKDVEFDIGQLRKTPNIRQCVSSQVLTAVREVMDQYDPSINI